MSIIRKARLYFWPPQTKWHAVPKQTITPYDFLGATEDERLIMSFGRARSPMEARRLMDQHGARNAGELIRMLPRPKRRTFWARWRALLARLDGSSRRSRLTIPQNDYRLPIRVRLKKDQ